MKINLTGILPLAFVILLVLKVTGAINIDWQWVFAPIIIGGTLWALVLLLLAALAAIASNFKDR